MPGYSVAGLRHGIERANHNISVLEQAIAKEKATIAEYRFMIRAIEKAEKAQSVVHVDVEVEDE